MRLGDASLGLLNDVSTLLNDVFTSRLYNSIFLKFQNAVSNRSL